MPEYLGLKIPRWCKIWVESNLLQEYSLLCFSNFLDLTKLFRFMILFIVQIGIGFIPGFFRFHI